MFSGSEEEIVEALETTGGFHMTNFVRALSDWSTGDLQQGTQMLC